MPYLSKVATLPRETCAAKAAFEMAGVGRDEIDVDCIYDCYTITALLTIEDSGFCAKGEGMRFVADHDRRQLEDLIGVARENDALAKRLHRLTLALIETHSFDEVLNTLQDELREQFKADAVEMKLFASDQLEAHAHEAGPALFSDFIQRGRPNCGRLDKQKLEYLFGPQAGETGSAALIPLSAPPLAGVLAIGSRDPDRFHEGKSVDFLQRLAEVVSVTLQSAAGPGV